LSGGEVASIDGLRFVVPRRTIHAAYNRRYFDRRRGVTLLGTTADHYAGLHTVVITGTQPTPRTSSTDSWTPRSASGHARS
jgi:TnpA family transposase